MEPLESKVDKILKAFQFDNIVKREVFVDRVILDIGFLEYTITTTSVKCHQYDTCQEEFELYEFLQSLTNFREAIIQIVDLLGSIPASN